MEKLNLKIIDIVLAFSEAFDLISKKVNNHHYDVAYLTFEFSKKLNIEGEELNNLMIAALLHDIGCLKDSEKIKLLDFEYKYAEEHAVNGFNLLKENELLSPSAEYVKYHHHNWKDFADKDRVALLSNLIYIADRIAILYNKDKDLTQLDEIGKRLYKDMDKKFAKELVDLFDELKLNKKLWENFTHENLENILKIKFVDKTKKLNYEEILKLGEFYARLIDLKSRFTAVHSIGVSATAENLAQLLGIDSNEQRKLKLAGYFHDIGKLAVPNAIIDKKAKLTDDEYAVMKKHPFHTFRLISKINGFAEIAAIAAQHHESLSGEGYPLGLTSHCLSYNSRILAVADVFTALTEKRPYRDSMNKEEVISILREMVSINKLDENIVLIAIEKYEQLKKANLDKQKFIFNKLTLNDNLITAVN